jgi:hypothetical protein
MSRESNENSNKKNSLTHLDSIIEINNASSSSNIVELNNNNNNNESNTNNGFVESASSTTTSTNTTINKNKKRSSEQIHLLNVNVVNEETTAKMMSASACSIASSSGNKKFRLKSSSGSGSGGGGVGLGIPGGGGLLASLKNTTLTASKIISRATSTSRSSSPTNATKNPSNNYTKANETIQDINQPKKTFKLKSFKHTAIENELDSGGGENPTVETKLLAEDDDDDDDIKNSKLNLNYANLPKQTTSSYKEMLSNMNRAIDSHELVDFGRQILFNTNLEDEEDEDTTTTNNENLESVQGDLDESCFMKDNKNKNQLHKNNNKLSKQNSTQLTPTHLNNSADLIKIKSNRANSFSNNNRSLINSIIINQKVNENQVPLITNENMDLMSINTDDEYTTNINTNSSYLKTSQPSKPILSNSNKNINILTSNTTGTRQHSTVSFSDATLLDNSNNNKSNETLINLTNIDQRKDSNNNNLLLDDPKLQFIDSVPPSPKLTTKDSDLIINNVPVDTQLSSSSKLSNNLLDLNASIGTTTNKTMISSTSISTLNQSKSIKTQQHPGNLKLKPMTTGSKAMRIMGNNSAFMGNGPLKNQLSGGGLSNKSGGSLSNKAVKKQQQQKRLFFKNGNINISRSNIDKRRRRYLTDIFTTLIDLKWRYNVLVFSLGFLISWISFAVAWYLISYVHGDLNHINDPNYVACISGIHSFIGAILFSIETQQTIGKVCFKIIY